MNTDILLGKTTEHVVPLEGTNVFLHKDIIRELQKLKLAAREAGFELEIASGFRSFDRQKLIWDAKARGERKLLDDHGNELKFSDLSPKEVMFSILRWSALPGASRHHWGTDLDVFNSKTQSREEVQLTTAECTGDGPAAAFHDWLDSQIAQKASFGFYRPYREDLGGVAPERWHLSYAHISDKIMVQYTYSLFRKNIEESDFLLKDLLLENSQEIFERYFLNISAP